MDAGVGAIVSVGQGVRRGDTVCPATSWIDLGAAGSVVVRRASAYAVVEQLAVPTVTVMTMPGDVRYRRMSTVPELSVTSLQVLPASDAVAFWPGWLERTYT